MLTVLVTFLQELGQFWPPHRARGAEGSRILFPSLLSVTKQSPALESEALSGCQ